MLPFHVIAYALLSVSNPFVVPVPEYDRLESRQRELFEAIASEEFCGCDSGLPLLKCLHEKPQCGIAGALGRVLARASGTGATRTTVSMFMSQTVVGPFCANPQPITFAKSPTKGARNASLQVVEFFDYRCTHCRAAMPTVHAGIQAHKDKAALTLLPIALVEQSPSQVAAEAALAAHAQNKFWPMHEALFEAGEPAFTSDGVKKIAKRVGLHMPTFEKAMNEHTYRAQLQEYRKQFLSMGLEGTPALFVNGRRFDMEPKALDLAERLRMETLRGSTGCE